MVFQGIITQSIPTNFSQLIRPIIMFLTYESSSLHFFQHSLKYFNTFNMLRLSSQWFDYFSVPPFVNFFKFISRQRTFAIDFTHMAFQALSNHIFPSKSARFCQLHWIRASKQSSLNDAGASPTAKFNASLALRLQSLEYRKSFQARDLSSPQSQQ